MTPADALAWLVAEDVARRARENPPLGMAGAANRKKLVAWRRANERCPKCGRAIPADEQFIYCPRCRAIAFAEYQRHINRNLTHTQRLARNARSNRSYHKLTHGRPPPPKVVTPPGPNGYATGPMVTPDPRWLRRRPRWLRGPRWLRTSPASPKRDRAAYMRAYRANQKSRSGKE